MQQTTARVPDNEQMGAGVIYGNYGETTQFEMGATSGGNSFNMNTVLLHDKSDSDQFEYVKGAIDIDSADPTLSINNFVWAIEGMTYFAGMAKQAISGGTVKIYQGMDVAYPLTNVAWVGESRAGYAMAVVLNNPIAINGLNFSTERNKPIMKPIEFHATPDPLTYDATDATTAPCYIEEEASALTLTVQDDAGTPVDVEGALVVFGDGQSGTSDVGGEISLTVTKGKLYYTASKSGYTTTSGYLTIDEDTETLTITLPITP